MLLLLFSPLAQTVPPSINLTGRLSLNYDLIVFDLDGTLVDTIPEIADVFNTVLLREGFSSFSELQYRDFVGWGLKKAVDLVLPGDLPEETSHRILEQIIEEYGKRPARLSLVYPGISSLIAYLQESGASMIVYTNKAESLARAVVEELFPQDIFDTVLGYTEAFPHKPNPGYLIEYLSGKKHSLSSILMVGDTPVDLETSENAGISFAGASWGFRSEKILREAGSLLNFSGPEALQRWLMNK